MRENVINVITYTLKIYNIKNTIYLVDTGLVFNTMGFLDNLIYSIIDLIRTQLINNINIKEAKSHLSTQTYSIMIN